MLFDQYGAVDGVGLEALRQQLLNGPADANAPARGPRRPRKHLIPAE
jgi:hypothetical protein